MSDIKRQRFCNLAAGEHFYMAKPDDEWKPRTSILYVKLPIGPATFGNARIVAATVGHSSNVNEKVVIADNAPVCSEREWQRVKEYWRQAKQRRKQQASKR